MKYRKPVRKYRKQGWQFFSNYVRLDNFQMVLFLSNLDIVLSKSPKIFEILKEHVNFWKYIDYKKIKQNDELERIRKYYGWSRKELEQNKDILFLILNKTGGKK